MGMITAGKPTVPTCTRTSFSDVFCLLDLLSGVEQQSVHYAIESVYYLRKHQDEVCYLRR